MDIFYILYEEVYKTTRFLGNPKRRIVRTIVTNCKTAPYIGHVLNQAIPKLSKGGSLVMNQVCLANKIIKANLKGREVKKLAARRKCTRVAGVNGRRPCN